MYDNVIISDYDGVLGYWEHAFDMWMVTKGHTIKTKGTYDIESRYGIDFDEASILVSIFNESSAIRKLPPVRDSIKYVRKLHEDHGYVFHIITAIPNTPETYNARLYNIEALYGKTAIERLTLCNESSEKQGILKEYTGSECFWIEDHPDNAEYGLQWGLRPILLAQHYNDHYYNEQIPRVQNWAQIYEYIVNGLHPLYK